MAGHKDPVTESLTANLRNERQMETVPPSAYAERIPQSSNQTPSTEFATPDLASMSRVGNTAGVRVVHVVEDGFTALGKVWYRGEEIRLAPGSGLYEETVDRQGNSFLDLTEDEQLDRWDKVCFREGPWRGKGYDAATFTDATGELSPDELKRLEKRRQREQGPPLKPASA